MERYFLQKGYLLTATHLYLGQKLPSPASIDWLIVMGGPMGVFDEQEYPWLVQEKAFIKSAIDAGKMVLGICLGAQLIADVMGARVYRNNYREIGWFPIEESESAKKTALSAVLPLGLEVFHWHGDTFDIPKGSVLLASSEACQNQGFIAENRIVGLQFHLETTMASATALIEHCGNELDDSKYVQTAYEIMSKPKRFHEINNVMGTLLEKLEENA
jgi:GMP synthase-like glutamine amidotransferase